MDCSWQSEVINNGIEQFCQSWVFNNFALFWCLMFSCVFFLIFDKIYFDFKCCQYLLPILILLPSNLSLSNAEFQWFKENHPRCRQTGHLTLGLLHIPTYTCFRKTKGCRIFGITYSWSWGNSGPFWCFICPKKCRFFSKKFSGLVRQRENKNGAEKKSWRPFLTPKQVSPIG